MGKKHASQYANFGWLLYFNSNRLLCYQKLTLFCVYALEPDYLFFSFSSS